ncbi:MAG: hypothetical protein AAF203_08045 [Pseudomonadota bacterium]
MNFFEQIVAFLFPTSMILSKSQLEKYQASEESNLRLIMIFMLPLLIMVYIGHYFFFDIPMNLQPRSRWFNYRFGMAGAIFGVFLYYWRFHRYKFVSKKLPAILIFSTACYMQSMTILWYKEVPYLYSYIFIVISAFSLRLAPFHAILFASTVQFLHLDILVKTGLPSQHMYSAFIVTLVMSLILSSINYFQVKVYLSNENLLEEQRKNIEQNMEFTRTLKSFLPKKISRNLDEIMTTNRMGIHQAVDEILRPKKRNISCLACDIRGYTEKSKDISYIVDSVIPLTKDESSIVESHQGIPRKIGDLLFCYFDDESLLENTKNSLMAGINISLSEQAHNQEKSLNQQIRKQIIISIGEAYVGNIGGLNSAVEITAMGTPVNFLSRLETVVKSGEFIDKIPRDHIIVSSEVFQLISELNRNITFSPYTLSSTNIKIKDFESITTFYSFEANLKNYESIKNLVPVKFDFLEDLVS